MSKDLVASTYVFVHHDAVRTPLQPPYDGPYRVLKRTDKHYTLEVTNRLEVVSLDCLKPAFMEYDLGSDGNELAPTTTTAQPSTLPKTVTHFGQQVGRPVHFC